MSRIWPRCQGCSLSELVERLIEENKSLPPSSLFFQGRIRPPQNLELYFLTRVHFLFSRNSSQRSACCSLGVCRILVIHVEQTQQASVSNTPSLEHGEHLVDRVCPSKPKYEWQPSVVHLCLSVSAMFVLPSSSVIFVCNKENHVVSKVLEDVKCNILYICLYPPLEAAS